MCHYNPRFVYFLPSFWSSFMYCDLLTKSWFPNSGNALERVQWVHEPADLWDNTFWTRRFWPIKFQKILLCSVAELIGHETKHTYLRDIKHFLPIATNFEFFSRFRFAQKATIVLKSTLCGLKTSNFKMTKKKSIKLLKNEATLCPSKSFMIACFKFYSNPWILWRLIFKIISRNRLLDNNTIKNVSGLNSCLSCLG